jgi:hypothetical protein
MSELDKIDLNIQRKGRAWTTSEVVGRLDLFPARAESIDGKLFWTEEQRLTALALLLENVGIDKAVRLGNAELWRQAIEELVEARK